MISKTPRQFRKNSSDKTYWLRINWIYKDPKANTPTAMDLNLKCIFEKMKLKINKVPQNILLINIKSVDNETKQKNNII